MLDWPCHLSFSTTCLRKRIDRSHESTTSPLRKIECRRSADPAPQSGECGALAGSAWGSFEPARDARKGWGEMNRPLLSRLGLRGKLVLVMLIVSLLPVLLGLVLTAWVGTFQLRQAIGSHFEELAKEAANNTNLAIQREASQLEYLGGLDAIRSVLARPDSESIRKAGLFLDRFIASERPEGILSLKVYDNGGNLVAGNREPVKDPPLPSRFSAPPSGVVLGPIYQDSATKTYLFDLLYPISNPLTDERLGTFVETYDLNRFLKPYIFEIRLGKTGHAMLIDSHGTVLICPILATGSHVTDPQLLSSITAPEPGWVTAARDGHGGENSIVGFAPVSFRGIESAAPWHSFIRQDPHETDAPIRSLLTKAFLSGLSLVGIMAVLVFVAAERMVRPIRLLREGTRQIGAGALEHRLQIHTGDEIESLASAFNEMAQKLSESYATLEQKVEDRTRTLAAMNQIGSTVIQSLRLQDLLQGSLMKILELFRVESGQVHLIEEGEPRPMLRAQVGPQREDPLIYQRIAEEVIRSQRPIWVEDLQRRPAQETLPGLTLPSEFRSMVSVPIRSPQQVLGCLTLASLGPWPYHPQQEETLLSMGNQIGTGAENAILYHKEKELVEQLMEMDRLKSEFLSNISHELRMPLTAIVGFSELLLDHFKWGLSDQQKEYLHNILNNGRHLSDLINTLLDLSKIRAGKMNIHLVRFSLNDLMEGMEKIIQPILIKKRLRFKAEIPPLPVFYSDANKVKQIVSNLLGNALKFTPEGGTVEVRIDQTTHLNRPAVLIRISDTGIGIPPEAIRRIFEPFHQVDSSYTRDYPGTGLGLPIAKSLVELLEGTILVESAVGKGSVFTVILPTLEETSDASLTGASRESTE
jgi:signal transduction histidine kinase/HAMP domain-containing protein